MPGIAAHGQMRLHVAVGKPSSDAPRWGKKEKSSTRKKDKEQLVWGNAQRARQRVRPGVSSAGDGDALDTSASQGCEVSRGVIPTPVAAQRSAFAAAQTPLTLSAPRSLCYRLVALRGSSSPLVITSWSLLKSALHYPPGVLRLLKTFCLHIGL